MSKHIFLLAIILHFFLQMSAPPLASAQEQVFSESFATDLHQWQPTRDDGRYWKIVDQALEAYIPFRSTISELVPTDQAWDISTKNFTYEFDFTALQGADHNVSFGITDTNNWYEIHFTPSFTEIVRVKTGRVVWSAKTGYVLPYNTPQHFSIAFHEGRILLSSNNDVLFDVTDTSFEHNYGKIGVKATTGSIFPTKVRIDNILVKKIIPASPQPVDTILGVELIKQTDQSWANMEYDTASQWASTLGTGEIGFKDWACNLIAQLMVMKYHGIDLLPNGEPLTPVSLNAWLLSNKGYYDSPRTGNINRHSISGLTAAISARYGTPKLEFTYQSTTILETAIDEISRGNPVILELDGHFVVADGFTPDKQDLLIKDPAYAVDRLSKHHLPLKSLRLYTPSQTDLSYISVSSASDIHTEILTDDGQTLPLLTYSEKIRAATNGEATTMGPETYVTEIGKPLSSHYRVTLLNSSEVNQNVKLDVYASDGSRQTIFDGNIKPGTHTYSLNYSTDGPSTLTTNNSSDIDINELRKTIKYLRKNNEITYDYIESMLLQVMSSVGEVSQKNQLKLLSVLKMAIQSSPHAAITLQAKVILLDQIKLLMASLK